MSKAYLLGALHDATEREYTYRLSQKDSDYVAFIAQLVQDLNSEAWTYKEGQSRSVHIAEFNKSVLSDATIESDIHKRDYARGYFDADGSVPKNPEVRFYIYFAQQDQDDLIEVKEYLDELGIKTGTLHQPSRRDDPDYWRFYVSTASHLEFAETIGSWHPRKSQRLREMRRSTP